LACSIDLLPTLLDAAGLQIPTNIQGRSLVPLACGDASTKEHWRQYTISEIGGSIDNQVLTITSKTAKYVRFKQAGQTVHEQLFDLQQDPWEMHNLADDPAGQTIKTHLTRELAEWESKTPVAKSVIVAKKPRNTPRAKAQSTAKAKD